MSKEDNITVQWEKEYEKCKDPVYFYSNYLMIKNTDGTMSVPPPLSDKAKEDMRKWIGLNQNKDEYMIQKYWNVFHPDKPIKLCLYPKKK